MLISLILAHPLSSPHISMQWDPTGRPAFPPHFVIALRDCWRWFQLFLAISTMDVGLTLTCLLYRCRMQRSDIVRSRHPNDLNIQSPMELASSHQTALSPVETPDLMPSLFDM